MFNRFRTNVALYPRLFKVTLALAILAVVESCFVYRALMQTSQGRTALVFDGIFSLVLAGIIYHYVVRMGSDALDILNRFEGREVCNVQAHVPEPEEEECTCDNEQGCLVHDEPEEL